MRMRRLRTGELTALVGAVGLFVLMFLHWFRADVRYFGPPPEGTGWGSLGWFAAVLLGLAIVTALTAVVLAAKEQSPAMPVAADVLTALIGLLATIAIVSRLVFQPAFGTGAPDSSITVLAPAWLGLLCSVLITVGGWIALKDERTDAPAAPQPEIELRPIPPPS
jgi:hypothetical protein